MNMEHIIFFDGVCNFCNSAVQFIIKRDPKAYFTFSALQNEAGQKKLAEHVENPEALTADPNSFILLSNGKLYTKSTASLQVMKKLSGLWPILFIFIIIPKPIRDFFYTLFAKNRYRLFGKKDSCMLPSKENQARFL